MPVYRQYTYLCNKQAVMKANSSTTTDEEIGCKDTDKTKDASFLYFDSLRKYWKLGPFLGSNSISLVAASKVLSPDQVDAGQWQVGIAGEAKQLAPAAGVTVSCKGRTSGCPQSLTTLNSVACRQPDYFGAKRTHPKGPRPRPVRFACPHVGRA
jgi:hypothetical protein